MKFEYELKCGNVERTNKSSLDFERVKKVDLPENLCYMMYLCYNEEDKYKKFSTFFNLRDNIKELDYLYWKKIYREYIDKYLEENDVIYYESRKEETVVDTCLGTKRMKFTEYHYRTENDTFFTSLQKLCDVGDKVKITVERLV